MPFPGGGGEAGIAEGVDKAGGGRAVATGVVAWVALLPVTPPRPRGSAR